MKPLPKFTAVIHVTSDAQAITQTEVALSNGADGVFLIDHRRTAANLLMTYDFVRAGFPDAWIGLNFLDLSSVLAVKAMPEDADALWTDRQAAPHALSCIAARHGAGEHWRYFASTAFKYQPEEDPVEAATRNASFFDVVCTSGPGTGEAAEVSKVRLMKEAIGNHPLALASGVTPQNAASFAPWADCFMVATGISSSFDRLDAAKVRELAGILCVTP